MQGETACNILVIQYKSQLWPLTQASEKKDIDFGNLDGQVPKLSEREKKARKLCKEFLIENCPSCSATKRELVPKKDSNDAGQTMSGLEIEDEVQQSKVRLDLKNVFYQMLFFVQIKEKTIYKHDKCSYYRLCHLILK